MTNMPKRVYPYSRCSATRQEEGDSFRRQGVAGYLAEGEVGWAEQLAKREGWIYDDTYSLMDRGRSGYHKKNLTPTAGLTRFLNLVKAGTIAPGSVLAVERLDRLTRQEIMGAAHLFLGIVASGIWIATKDPDRIYKAENASLFEVLEPLWIMYGSWVESHKKHDWSTSAWAAARQRHEETGGPVTMGRTPPWIERGPDGYQINEPKAEVVRGLHQLTWAGKGFSAIAKQMQREGVKPLVAECAKKRRWTSDAVGQWLRTRQVLGYTKDGKELLYPAIMTEDEWLRSQVAINSRKGKRGRPGVKTLNLFVGMVFDAERRRPAAIRSRHNGTGRRYPYLSTEHSGGFSVRYEVFESAMLRTLGMLRTEDVNELPEERSRLKEEITRLTTRLTELSVQVEELGAQIDRPENARILGRLTQSLDKAEEDRQKTAQTLDTLKLTVASGRSEALAETQTLTKEYANKTGPEKSAMADRIRAALPTVVDGVWVRAQKVSERRQYVHIQVWLRSGQCRYLRLDPEKAGEVAPWDCRPETVDFRKGT